MTREELVTLVNVYNSLMTIETKGNNTRKMAKALDELEQLIIQENRVKGVDDNGSEVIPTID